MTRDLQEILFLISDTFMNKQVLMQHDMARMTFRCNTVAVSDQLEFKYLITSYVEHHMRCVKSGPLNPSQCFGEAKRILDGAFNQDRFQEGLVRAYQMAKDGAQGGMRVVLDEIANAMKRRAMQDHMDDVFYSHIDMLSKDDQRRLSHAYFEEFGSILRRFNVPIDPDSFARDARAALEYHRQVYEHILGVAKKI